MRYRIARSAVSLMMVFMSIAQLNHSQMGVLAADSSKKKFSVVGYYPGPAGCHPVQVTAVSIGSKPPEVLTAQVTLVSFSNKPVTAVKLKWEVFRWEVAMKKRLSNCGVGPEAVETFLSGITTLIKLGPLAQKETCNISTYPLLINTPATKTVFVDQPIIAWDQVKPLTLDGSRNTFKEDYAAVIYVSEIQFEDGTTWSGGLK
jgi:hypothetical protein